MLTRRHFERFAQLIRESDNPPDVRMFAALVVIRIASESNPRFDRHRFLTACNLPTD